jgi:ketosteroid isomerase-like protein
MTSDTSDLGGAVAAFYDALNAVFAGDLGPMRELWSHADDVTYMSPFGDLLHGWPAIEESWRSQAEAISSGTVRPEELHLFASDTLGVSVGFERGEVTVDGVANPVDIRATSTFRLEDGAWKMIGHHTDRI